MKFFFPIRFKFLSVMLFILMLAIGVFFYVSFKTFSEDKKMFVLDLNMSVIAGAQAEIQTQVRQRLDEIQILASRVFSPSQWGMKEGDNFDPFSGLSETLRGEVLSVAFYLKTPGSEGKYVERKRYNNKALLKSSGMPLEMASELNAQYPLELEKLESKLKDSVTFRNRSIKVDYVAQPILTLLSTSELAGEQTSGLDIVVTVDLLQGFLVDRLRRSEMAELFLISRSGHIISHKNKLFMVDFADKAFPHPILARLKSKVLPRESFELNVGEEPHLINVSETGLKDILLVSQIKKKVAFAALRELFIKTLYLALAILCATVIIGILFSGRLTANIAKLGDAAERIGEGDLSATVDIKSSDEVERVAVTFDQMAGRITQLLHETATKARMESELKTAHLIQSTLLKTSDVVADEVDIASHYHSATECGGDFWDWVRHGSKFTLIIGDATGHGAPAALVTAVVKSCVSTLNRIYANEAPKPAEFLGMLNEIVFETCKGQLLMTMGLIQLDLETGQCIVANAGHESPFRLKSGDGAPAPETKGKKRIKPEVLLARGERLGFSPDSKYTSQEYQLGLGDVLLLYTDGITEAKNDQGREWGERKMHRVFAKGGARAVHDIKAELLAEFEKHTGGAEQEDDVTFVLMSWKKKSGQGSSVSSNSDSPEDAIKEPSAA